MNSSRSTSSIGLSVPVSSSFTRHSSLGRLLATLLFLGALFLASCATDRQVIDQADDAHRQLEPAVIDDPQMRGYLESMGQRIVTTARAMSQSGYGPKSHFEENNDWMFSSDIRFHFVNSKTLNAFTTGGDHMYIYTELLRTCRTEDELAAVLAHEYGHIYARHVHKGMNRQYGAMAVAGLAGLGVYLASGKENGLEYGVGAAALAMYGMNFVNMGRTREDEAEADELGFDFYVRAGWDPARFGDFFQQLVDKGLDKTPEAMSDHPSLSSRVAAAKRRAASLPSEAPAWRRPNVADEARFAGMKQRADIVAKNMPSDESLETAQTLLSAVPSCVSPVDLPDQKAAQQKIRDAVAEQERAAQRANQERASRKP